jgi:S1-C subfamily serine protease
MDSNWTPTPGDAPTPSHYTPYSTTPPPAAENQSRKPRGSRLVVPVLIASLLSASLAAGGTAAIVSHESGSTTTVVREVAQPSSNASSSSAAVAPASTDGQMSIAQMYKQEGAGVVRVEHSGGLGSGFVIDTEGHILTNAHVVDGAQGPISVSFSNNEKVQAKVIGVDNATDVAVLKVDVPASALTVMPLGSSSDLQVGAPVVAIGNPFGQDRTVTSGIISAMARQIQAPNGFTINGAIQTDAAINHGNSGGPLLDMNGKVIGINSQIDTGGTGNGNVGIGFAIPINLVKQVASQLMNGGKAQHAWLGVQLTDVDPTLASQVKIGSDYGAMIAKVTKGSPADKAGLTGATGEVTIGGQTYAIGGEVVVEANGKKIENTADLQAVVSAGKPGDKLDLTVKTSDGQSKQITVTLGDQPQDPTALAG